MEIRFTKLTNEKHHFAITRDDQSTEEATLETRSFLLHDWCHFAVEAEANIRDGLFGLLASGITLEQLSNTSMEQPLSPGLALAETLSGPLQSLWRGRMSDEQYIAMLRTLSPEHGTHEFLQRVRERLRRIEGHWKALRFRETMRLQWPSM